MIWFHNYVFVKQVKLYMKPYDFQTLKGIKAEANDAKNIDYLFRLPPPLLLSIPPVRHANILGPGAQV